MVARIKGFRAGTSTNRRFRSANRKPVPAIPLGRKGIFTL